jgi:hypothetical protein
MLTPIVEFAILTGLIAAILILLIVVASATTLEPATQYLHASARPSGANDRRDIPLSIEIA